MYNLLSGITVIEVSSFVASPTIGLYLAQFGAEVIRVDQIGGGQDFKRWPLTPEGHSLSWENLNRAKKSVALDLTSREGRDVLTKLIQSVGTLVTNLPVGGFLAHEKLAAGRPDLITVRVMGWPDGAIALDYTANAVVGYPALTGTLADPSPVNHVLPAWDLLTGAYGAFALVSALRRRDETGLGGEVRLPLTDIAMGSAANLGRVAEVLQSGEDRERLGNGVYGTIGRDFVTADGVRVMIVAINERQWQGLVRALDLQEGLAALEAQHGVSFTGDDGVRYRHRDAIYALIEQAIAPLSHAALSESSIRTASPMAPTRPCPKPCRTRALSAKIRCSSTRRTTPAASPTPPLGPSRPSPAWNAAHPRPRPCSAPIRATFWPTTCHSIPKP